MLTRVFMAKDAQITNMLFIYLDQICRNTSCVFWSLQLLFASCLFPGLRDLNHPHCSRDRPWELVTVGLIVARWTEQRHIYIAIFLAVQKQTTWCTDAQLARHGKCKCSNISDVFDPGSCRVPEIPNKQTVTWETAHLNGMQPSSMFCFFVPAVQPAPSIQVLPVYPLIHCKINNRAFISSPSPDSSLGPSHANARCCSFKGKAL